MKVLLVDDHALIRDGLQTVLRELRPHAIVLEAADCSAGLRLANEHPDLELVVLDLGFPDGSGFALLAELQSRPTAAAIVVLSAAQDPATINRALDLGAAGFIPKSAKRSVMLGAFQLVFAGGIYVPAEARQQPTGAASEPREASINLRATSPAEIGLTQRQIEVAALMVRGKSNKVICRELHIAEATVKNHMTAIFRALKVSNRTEAVIAINDRGWRFS
jgi:DNA-binding NarL/FixJ family response regulator